MKRAQIGIVDVEDEASIEAALIRAVNLIDVRKPPPNSTVVIKPNLCRAMSPESGATVDTRIVEVLVKILKEKEPSCKIAIVESDTYVRDAEEVFDRLGYVDLAKHYGVELVNLTDDEKYSVAIPFYNRNILFPHTLMKCEYFVSVAKLKTYRPYLRITCTMKNLFGCVPRKHKASFHPFLPELTTGLCTLLKPDLCVVDGIICMEGEGPISGKPKPMNLLLCGNDVVGTDFVAAKIMGFNPRKVPLIKYALEHGVGQVSNIEVRGKKLEDVRTYFEYKSPAFEISLLNFLSRCGLVFVRFGHRIRDFGDVAYSNPPLFVERHVPHFLFYRLRTWAMKRYKKRRELL